MCQLMTSPICYHADTAYVDEETGEFQVIAVRRDQPGYIVESTHPGRESAENHADVLNEQRGIDHATKNAIIDSAIAASRAGRVQR